MTKHKHEERTNKPMRRVQRIIYIFLIGALCLFAGWGAAMWYHSRRQGDAPRNSLLLAPSYKEGIRSEGTIRTLEGRFAVGLPVPAYLLGKVQARPDGEFELEFHTQPWNP